MSPAIKSLACPHCGGSLQPFEMPDDSGWNPDELVHWACWNDDCVYFREGWLHMLEQYEAKASYRYRVTNPETGAFSPLPVWSKIALRDRILPCDDPGDTS